MDGKYFKLEFSYHPDGSGKWHGLTNLTTLDWCRRNIGGYRAQYTSYLFRIVEHINDDVQDIVPENK